jgi:hypothetical protein
MDLDSDGAQLFPAAFAPAQIRALEIALATTPSGRAGTRLQHVPGLADAVQPATEMRYRSSNAKTGLLSA